MTKRLIITIITSYLKAGSAANAASCKYTVNETDLFTKQRLVTTEWHKVVNAFAAEAKNSHIYVAAVREGDQRFIAVRIKVFMISDTMLSNQELSDALYVAEGSPLTISLADESNIVLDARKNVRATTRRVGDNGIESIVVAHFPLDADSMDALLYQDASFGSIAVVSDIYSDPDEFAFSPIVSDGQITFKMGRKGRGRFIEALTCLDKA